MLGYIGIYETTKKMIDMSHKEGAGKAFATEVMKKMKEKCDKWKDETGLAFELYATPAYEVGAELIDKDYETFGKIKDITDKDSYTDSYHINEKDSISIEEKLKIEAEFEKLSSGGGMSIVNVEKDMDKLEQVIKLAYDNIVYLKLKVKV